MIGIATSDFDFNRASYETNNNFGWYYYCYYGSLYSGQPHYYQDKKTNLKSKKNEVNSCYEYEEKKFKIYY